MSKDEDWAEMRAFANISSAYRRDLEKALKPDIVIPQQPDGSFICCDTRYETTLDLFEHRQEAHSG